MPPSSQLHNSQVRSLLLVRNGVDHDARVLRAARVARRALGGRTLVVGVATASAPAGEASVEGVAVLRLPARAPLLARLVRVLGHSALVTRAPRRQAGLEPNSAASLGTDSEAMHKSRSDAPRAPHLDPRASPVAPRLTPAGRARRALSGASFALQALSVALRSRPQLVHANDWNTMWAGLLVKSMCGSRLVYDSHELWADRNGRWEWRPWLLACEALFVRAADEVLTSSPGYADALATRYRIPRPTVVRNIPEGPRAPDSPPASESPRDSKGHSVPESPHVPEGHHTALRGRPEAPLVVYIGGLMPGRGLEQMIDTLPLLPEARLRAVGPGAPHYRASLLARAQATGVLDRVELCQPVAPAEVGVALAEAAAGLCLIQPICRSYELCLPNKLFEYAAAGVPVLASDLPVIGPLVRSEGFGALAPAADPHAIAASLERLLEPNGWQLAAQRARAFADAHSWAGEARTLAGVYARARAGTQTAGVPRTAAGVPA